MYRGNYKANKKHGEGELHWRNGIIFIGNWVNGMKEGVGTVSTPQNEQKKVICKNDKIINYVEE